MIALNLNLKSHHEINKTNKQLVPKTTRGTTS